MLRIWLGLLALGAGLVHVALVIGSPPIVAAVLLIVGLAEFVWGAVAIAMPAPPLPQLARAAAFVPVVGWALLLIVAGTDSLGPLTSSSELLPMLVASFFDLLIAAGLTVLLRREGALAHRPQDAAPADPSVSPRTDTARLSSRRRLVVAIVGGLVIAAITAPALAATEAGQFVGKPGTSVFDTTGHDH